MTEKIKTALIDTPDEVTTDYWTNEWINEDEIIEGLVDESVVLTIANERVKKRLISVSKEAKAIEETNCKLRNELYEAKEKIKSLELELKDSNSKIHDEALKILKDVEREQYGYAIGDRLFMICEHTESEEVICPACNGNKVIHLDKDYYCPKCSGCGKIIIYNKLPPTIQEIEITQNKATYYLTEDKTSYSYNKSEFMYHNIGKDGYGVISEDKKVFKAKAEAEEYVLKTTFDYKDRE